MICEKKNLMLAWIMWTMKQKHALVSTGQKILFLEERKFHCSVLDLWCRHMLICSAVTHSGIWSQQLHTSNQSMSSTLCIILACLINAHNASPKIPHGNSGQQVGHARSMVLNMMKWWLGFSFSEKNVRWSMVAKMHLKKGAIVLQQQITPFGKPGSIDPM